jgi:hypothetical protein
MTKPRRPTLHLLPQLPRRDSAEYVETVAYERIIDVGGQEYTVRAELSRAVVADPAEPDADAWNWTATRSDSVVPGIWSTTTITCSFLYESARSAVEGAVEFLRECRPK